jgi:hypothetical protein
VKGCIKVIRTLRAPHLHIGVALKIARRLRTALYFALFVVAGCGTNHTYVPAGSGDGGSLQPASTASSSTSSIAACPTTITKAGTYVLDGDLTGGSSVTGPPCITIQNTSNVTFNCHNHTISGTAPDLLVSSVNGFTVENCNLQQPSPGDPLVTIASSSNGTLRGSTIGNNTETFPSWVDVAHSSAINMHANTFYFYVSATYSTGVVLDTNSFSCGYAHGPFGEYCATLINLQYGSKNQVTNNTMDGETPVDATGGNGSDDIVNVGEETSDTFTGNTMKNVWDCGIEVVYGSLTSSTISNNTITNATNCAIGGWYYVGLSNSTIADNAVSGSTSLFRFYRIGGLRPAGVSYPGAPADTGVYFTNNTFTGNTLTNWYGTSGGNTSFLPFDDNGDYMDYSEYNPQDTVPTPSQFHLTNNVFSGNDFGPVGTPYFGSPIVSGDTIDKGGNRCIPESIPNYPILCGKP